MKFQLVEALGHIVVLMGGCSSEREISLKSGKAVFHAFKDLGCHVDTIDLQTQDPKEIMRLFRDADIDVAFIALHGRLGEDGVIQSLCENLHIAYTGSGVESSQRAFNKVITQQILKENNIPVPPHMVLQKNQQISEEQITNQFSGQPIVVKPAREGSSIGVTIVRKKEDLLSALKSAFNYDDSILIEGFIQGKELTVGILGPEALPVVEIKPKETFFDFHAKYNSTTTEYVVPAPLPTDIACNIQEVALKAHRSLGCRDFSRVDLILDENNYPFVLEVNTIPGFTGTSLLPKAAASRGMDFTHLCLKILELTYAKKKQETKIIG